MIRDTEEVNLCNFLVLHGKSPNARNSTFTDADLFSVVESNQPFEYVQVASTNPLHSMLAPQLYAQLVALRLHKFQWDILDKVFYVQINKFQ